VNGRPLGSGRPPADFAGDSLDAIAGLPEAEQRRRFGGTLAPTLRLALDDDRTRVLGTLDHWTLPVIDEPLPDLAPHDPGGRALADTATGDAGGYGGDDPDPSDDR
jgi:levansucrase